MSDEETSQEKSPETKQLFIDGVRVVCNILKEMPELEFEKELVFEAEDVSTWKNSKLTTYSLYLMLSGLLVLWDENLG